MCEVSVGEGGGLCAEKCNPHAVRELFESWRALSGKYRFIKTPGTWHPSFILAQSQPRNLLGRAKRDEHSGIVPSTDVWEKHLP